MHSKFANMFATICPLLPSSNYDVGRSTICQQSKDYSFSLGRSTFWFHMYMCPLTFNYTPTFFQLNLTSL